MKKILIAISLLLTAHGLYAQESLTIEVKTAGTLGTLVQEANPNYLSEVKQLTLSGQLNGDDMAVLRNMAGCNDDEESAYYVGALRDLDMSEARIVEGGAAYHSEYSFATSSYVDFFAENDVVGPYLFYNCGRITTVKFPHTTKVIGKSAMSFCKNLVTIDLPTGSALTIGEDAFGNCSNLRQVVIPENVKSIDDLAFNYCTNLKNVVCCSSTAPEAFYKNEYENVFAGTNETYLRIYVPDGSAESYKAQKAWNQFSVVEYSPDAQIGEMMEYIHITMTEAGNFDQQFHYTYPDQEFYVKKMKVTGPINGTDVGIIRGMSSIGKLADLDLSDTRIKAGGASYSYYDGNYYNTEDDKITKYMFNSSYSLRNITLPETVTSVCAPGTFTDSLATITVPTANAYYHDVEGVLYSNADKALRFCPKNRSLGMLAVEDGTELIGDSACMENLSIEQISLPTTLRTIGKQAFYFCENLTSATIPEGVTDIKDDAFCYTGLTDLSLPSTLKSMGQYSFCCGHLATIHCYAEVPPTLSTTEYAQTFYSVNTADCKLYVPEGTAVAYAKAEGWKDFVNVEEMVSDGISAATTTTALRPVATYTIDGRQATPGMKGLQIVVDENGKAHKVVR